MKKQNLVVFDMDGVIIDVSNSYRDTVRQTTKLFYHRAQSSEKLPEPLFQPTDLAGVKQSGGLNNDWDLSCLIINLLFSLVECPQIHDSKNPWIKYRKTIGHCDVSPLAEFLKSTNKPLTTLLQKIGKEKNPFISSLYVGDVGSGNIIKQIFQEIYLGPQLFESTYGLIPELYPGKGYIHRESLLIDRGILKELAENNILAIATGRPRAEADYPLKHFGLKKYFAMVYALEDCLREEQRILQKEGKEVSLSKPNPFMLDAIAKTSKNVIHELYYVGDMPDDMLAAARSESGFKGVGLIISAPDQSSLKKELQRAGADYIVEDFEAIKKIIESN